MTHILCGSRYEHYYCVEPYAGKRAPPPRCLFHAKASQAARGCVQGKKEVRIAEVPLAAASLNSGDVFVADLGERIFVWAGATCNPDEKIKALEVVEARRADRNGQAEVCVLPQQTSLKTACAEALACTKLISSGPYVASRNAVLVVITRHADCRDQAGMSDSCGSSARQRVPRRSAPIISSDCL